MTLEECDGIINLLKSNDFEAKRLGLEYLKLERNSSNSILSSLAIDASSCIIDFSFFVDGNVKTYYWIEERKIQTCIDTLKQYKEIIIS